MFMVMKVRLNGQEYETDAKTVMALLKELNIHPERVAVELNLKIIRKRDYGNTEINDGDTIEVVSFVGGGAIDTSERDKAGLYDLVSIYFK